MADNQPTSMAETELVPVYNQNMSFDRDRHITVIHHSADHDGAVSALIMRTYFSDIWFIGTNYGKKVNYNTIQPGSVIFLLDFTLPVDEMRMLKQFYTLVWIDHHATAWEDQYLEFQDVEGIRSPEASAAKLTWMYLHPEEPCPLSVALVSDYDTWKFTDPNTLPFHYGLELYNINPRQMSDSFIRKLLYNQDFMNSLISAGRRVEQYVETKNRLISNDGAFVSEINGHKVLCINLRNCNSKVLDEAAKKYPDIKLRSTFGYNSSIHKFKCSLYSDEGEGLVCQDIDSRFKGHKTAAGMECELKDLPYKLPSHDLKEPESFDLVSDIERLNLLDPLIYKHDSSALGYLVKLNGYPTKFQNFEAFAVNHPYWDDNAIYNTTMIFDYEIVIYWNLTSSGWFRYRIYPLEKNRLALQDIQNYIPGSKIVGRSVWCYRDAPPVSLETFTPPLLNNKA